jgi:hypothetical protein
MQLKEKERQINKRVHLNKLKLTRTGRKLKRRLMED